MIRQYQLKSVYISIIAFPSITVTYDASLCARLYKLVQACFNTAITCHSIKYRCLHLGLILAFSPSLQDKLHHWLYITFMEPAKSKLHNLSLTYAEYLKSGRSIASSKIGKYVVYSELGRGAFGAVYKGMDDETKTTVAIKVLDLQAVEKQPNARVKEIRRRLCISESKLMMVCNSEHVVKCFDVYQNKSLKIMVLEYCNGGDLQDEITVKGRIPEQEAVIILKQLINGIAELHTHRIIHRDLKAENILSHNGVYKIADLGFSKQVEEEEVSRTTLGTITTMAPEVMKKQPYGLKADIWSLGIIFFQMVFGKVPYTSTNAIQMYNQIQTKKILNSEQFEFNGCRASKEVTRFLREIICIDKAKRLGWRDLLDHEIFCKQDAALANQFRLDCDLRKPAIKLDDHLENAHSGHDDDLKLPTQPHDNMQHMLIRLTQLEVDQKMKQARTHDDELYKWAKQTHLEQLKTELIYHEIFEVIQRERLLDLQDRLVLQFMYLVLTRCLNNISVISDKIKHEQPNNNVLTKLQQSVNSLYLKVTTAWKRYSALLTEAENKVGSIIGDRFLKIFNAKSIETKDKFLTGIEKMYYTKEEQVAFTAKEYIAPLRQEIANPQSAASRTLQRYLSNYERINAIRLADIREKNFVDYVETMMQ